ncbi:hypothetical protein BEWA_019380 [Theileria equi strain WA]|uniref:Importin N-terminal domain-containing protein n=1 Tax=Theileria equi strain WA TaxID=1537102 RepID=L0AV21_THEEQ|nr:hypothetical protein BEWA_019380 [Theileria equi strain WA]AFZ79093.1 hypothetical protein BEWA_019380 [Theileria equi strain WA]|eukprot:XP_004828759.1 hypothetical protein BEWA_019380 [Theileria equi strain WA]
MMISLDVHLQMDKINLSSVQALVEAFEGSVSADSDHRHKCENYLIEFSKNPGAIPVFLQIISSPQFDAAVRLAASIRMKNHVISHWTAPEEESNKDNDITIDDKRCLLENIYGCITSAGSKACSIRPQCYETLRHVLFNVEIQSLATLLSAIRVDLEQRNDSDRLFCALSVLRKVMAKYEYHGAPQLQEVNDAIEAYFPLLLSIAQDSSKVGLQNDEAATLIHFVLKIYFSSALLTSPSTPILKDSLSHWIELIKFVLTNNSLKKHLNDNNQPMVPFTELSYSKEKEISALPQFKCLKWALRILNRFISRQNSDFSDNEIKRAFFSSFTNNGHATGCAHLLINLLDCENNGSITLTNLTHHSIWLYLKHSLSCPHAYANAIKPHINKIVSEFCLKTFSYTLEDEQQYYSEPEMFIQTLSDVCFQFYTGRGSASSFLSECVEKQPEDFLPPISFLVQEKIKSNDPQVLYAVMSLLGYVSSKIVKRVKSRPSKQKNKLNHNCQIDGEAFLTNWVYKLMESENFWLRMRGSWLSGCLAKRVHIWRNPDVLQRIYLRLLALLTDPEIITSVLAAGAIVEFVKIECKELQEVIVQQLPYLLTSIFKIIDKIELESVTSALGDIVDLYSDEILPFASKIVTNIGDALMKSLTMSKLNISDSPDVEEGMLVRWSMLQTLNNIVCLVTDSDSNKKTCTMETYIAIINHVCSVLKTIFKADPEECCDYLDEAALLLNNIIKMADPKKLGDDIFTAPDGKSRSGISFQQFWLLFVDLADLLESLTDDGDPIMDMINDFSVIRLPLCTLISKDPRKFDETYSLPLFGLCGKIYSNEYVEESYQILADTFETGMKSRCCDKILLPTINHISNNILQIINTKDIDSAAYGNMQLLRLASLVLIYYVQGSQTQLNVTLLVQFVVKFSQFVRLEYLKKVIIICITSLVRSGIHTVDNISLVQTLLTHIRSENEESPKDSSESTKSKDTSKTIDSTLGNIEDYTDSDYTSGEGYTDDSDWSDYSDDEVIETSPFKDINHLQFAKETLEAIHVTRK